MNPASNFRRLLLLLFVLLQCMAPFAHAHVGGQSADHHVHLPLADMHHELDRHTETQHALSEEDHSQVVGGQPENRAKKFKLPQLAVADAYWPIAIVVIALILTPFIFVARTRFSFYQHPLSQAPPA